MRTRLEKLLNKLYGNEWSIKPTKGRKVIVERNNNPKEEFATLQDAIDTYEGRLGLTESID